MESSAFKSMSTEELWNLHERVVSTLADKIANEKAKLEERLRRIEGTKDAMSPDRPRRPYPKVFPKYRNPKNPVETWSGRGKQPHWVQAQLKAGKRLDHFLIPRSSIEKLRRTG